MAGGDDLVFGTIIFVVVGVLGCIFSAVASVMGKFKSEMLPTALASVFFGVVGCWVMWIGAYLHQWHPLIAPTAEGA